MKNIKLINDTIDLNDIKKLTEWLETNPRLTKGDLTLSFERMWSKWLGRKHSVYVNSGSSANLAMLYSLLLSDKLKNRKIIVPSVSWATTVTPAIQLGFDPILCECDKDTLGLDLNHLNELILEHDPGSIILVHVLAFPCKMDEILSLCEKHSIILVEDSCESIGSTYNGISTGNFGLMSTFSFYYGHHISTIEGGMVCTDDDELYNLLLSIRSHGWDRDLDENAKKKLRTTNNVSDFRSLFTFYYPAFNLRSTDLQAFIGINQIGKIDGFSEKRNKNFKLYQSLIKNEFWKIKEFDNCFVSNFAYPVITPNIEDLTKELQENNIECRPLVCGSIGLQPFWVNLYGEKRFDFADVVHYNGLYLPNNQDITEEDIKLICNIVNKHTK